MRKSILFSAVAVALSGMSYMGHAQDATGGAMDRTAPPAAQPSDNASAGDLRSTRNFLANVTEAAVAKDGFDNLTRRFVDADRDRINKNDLTRADWDKLNGRIEQFQKDWKAKYNQDFDIDKEDLVFNDQFRITRGEIGEAQPAGSRVDPGKPDTTPGAEADKLGGGDTNRDKGRNVAKVTFPASHGLPELYIPLINELPATWKIDVPDEVDGRKLYDNLLTHITMADEHKAMWPADVNDAYRAISHHVFLAIMNTPMTGSDMQKPGDMQPGAVKPGDLDRDRPATPANPR
ncbi:MAG: hypothetical protein H7Z14_20765 [Anaerolineae bacterium]|nr:hypothetical protein [Phycisphaerae bacterium]